MRYLVVLLVLLGLLVNFTQAPIAEAAASKKVVKVVVKKAAPKKVVVTKTVKGKKGTKTVKGTATVQNIFYSLASLIPCTGPDGKNFKTTKTDCDAINAFWNSHKPSTPSNSNSNNSGNNNSNNNSSNSNNNSNNNSNPAPTATAIPTPTPTAIPTPTPVVATISSASIIPCTSTSCEWYTTVIVNGSNFDQTTRVTVSDGIHTYGETTSSNYSPKDAQLVGGNGTTKIITDFYNLPTCTTYDVVLSTGAIQKAVFSTRCGSAQSMSPAIISDTYGQIDISVFINGAHTDYVVDRARIKIKDAATGQLLAQGLSNQGYFIAPLVPANRQLDITMVQPTDYVTQYCGDKWSVYLPANSTRGQTMRLRSLGSTPCERP